MATVRSRGEEAVLLTEYVVYTCLLGYLQRFGADGVTMQEISLRKREAANACNRLAERDAGVKAYIGKRYGGEIPG